MIRAGHSAGGNSSLSLAVNPVTNTIYATNVITNTVPFGGDSVYVINGATCDAATTTGCGQTPATITSKGPDLVSVFNAATCNAASTAGCGQAPAVLKVGDSGGGPSNSALSLAVDQATNTVYATNVIVSTVPFGGDSVYVINGATCDAANTTGCGQTPATVTTGSNPWGIAVD